MEYPPPDPHRQPQPLLLKLKQLLPDCRNEVKVQQKLGRRSSVMTLDAGIAIMSCSATLVGFMCCLIFNRRLRN